MSGSQSIVVRFDPNRMQNPDLDVRYLLPDLLQERSNGILRGDGYDYVGDEPSLLVFLLCDDPIEGQRVLLEVVRDETLLDNPLRDCVIVAVENDGDFEVVFPPNWASGFLPADTAAT